MAFPAPAEPGADKVHAGFAGWEEAYLMAMHTPDDERQWLPRSAISLLTDATSLLLSERQRRTREM